MESATLALIYVVGVVIFFIGFFVLRNSKKRLKSKNSMDSNDFKLNNLLQKQTLSESECVHTLVLIRKGLEILKASDASDYSHFDHLKFVCDWSLHMIIDRSVPGSFLVVNINRKLNDGKHGDTGKLINELSYILVGKLKEQLGAFLAKGSLPLHIVNDDQRWRAWLTNVLEAITGSPVLPIKKHEGDVSNVPLKEGMWAIEISIEKVNFDKLEDKTSVSDKETYCLRVLMSDTTTLIVPITP